MTGEKIRTMLERLVEICRDGQQGYTEAAEHISDSSLRAFFHDESLERGRYALELESELSRLGNAEVGATGSVAGALHRGWLNLTATVAGDDSVLAAVEQGEGRAKQVYEEALREPLPETVEGTVRSQAQGVIAAHDHVKLLRERLAA